MPAILDSQRRLRKFSSDHDSLQVPLFNQWFLKKRPRELPKTFEEMLFNELKSFNLIVVWQTCWCYICTKICNIVWSILKTVYLDIGCFTPDNVLHFCLLHFCEHKISTSKLSVFKNVNPKNEPTHLIFPCLSNFLPGAPNEDVVQNHLT